MQARDAAVVSLQAFRDALSSGMGDMLDDLLGASYLVDAGGRMVFCAPAMAQLIGYPERDLLGRPSLEFYVPKAEALFLSRRRSALLDEPVEPRLQTELVCARGIRRRVLLNVTSLRIRGRVAGRLASVCVL